MSDKNFTIQFRFCEVSKSATSNGLLLVIEYLESKKIGYKVYGKCSTFKTPRIEISSTSIEKVRSILEDVDDIFTSKAYPIKGVIYSVDDDVVEIHQIVGEQDDSMISEIISVKNTGNPIN